MELRFEKREISCLHPVLRAVKEQELTQEIRLTEELPDVGRVIAGWGQAILRSKEWQGSCIVASGGVQATVLYAPEDGSAPRKVDAWIPFQMKWDVPEADREGLLRLGLLLRFVDGRNLSARKILVRTGISCLAEALIEQRSAVYRAPAVPEDVQLLRRSYPVRLPREAGEKTFTLEENLETGSDPVGQIISYTLQPEISEARVSTDNAVIRGSGKLHLVYSDRDGRIRTRHVEVPFSQLAQLENAYDGDAQAAVMPAVTGLELDAAEDQLVLRCSLVVQYMISDRTVLELTEDAYSTCREVGLRQEELHLPMILDETRERIGAKGNFPELDLDGVDARLWVGFPKIRREGDRAEADIPGRFQLLGYDRDGKLRAGTVSWEVHAGLDVDGASHVGTLTLPLGEPQWSSAGNGMEVRGEVLLQTVTTAGQGLPMITALELGSLRQPDRDRPSLILCRSGRRNLWDIAKGAGSSVDAIRAVNAMANEPEENQMLLIPVQ